MTRPATACPEPHNASEPDPATVPRAKGANRAEWPLVALLTAVLAVLFLAPWNPWWVPTGDSEVFLVVARNLFTGQGLTFNGEPVAFIPPGWPLVLAGMFHLTTQYLWLKLLLILSMTGFLLASYAILRRFTTPETAALSVGLAALLSPLYPLTFWLHSDAFFALVAGVTGWLALKWGDSRHGKWLLAALVLGCAAGVFVRYAALVHCFVLAALACGSGPGRVEGGEDDRRTGWWPHITPRHWLGVGAVFVTSFGTYFALGGLLDAGGGPQETMGAAILTPQTEPEPFAGVDEEAEVPGLFHGTRDRLVTVPQMVVNRVTALPQWFSWTLFQPVRVAEGFGPVAMVTDYGTGLLAMLFLGIAAWQGMRRRAYLWLGVIVYVLAIGLNWPQVNNRYMVPVAPFLVAGVLVGLQATIDSLKLRDSAIAEKGIRVLRWLFVVMLVAINGFLWAVDVWVSRAPTAEDFYARYEAGIYTSLIAICGHLQDVPELEDGEIAASLRYFNLNRRWEYKTSPRVVGLFTGKIVRNVPKDLSGAGVRKAQSWARETKTRFYVQQNPSMPGRIWHFRVTPELQEAITGYPSHLGRPQFELFEMQPDPIPANPDLWSLLYAPVPVLPEEKFEEMTRSVPLTNKVN